MVKTEPLLFTEVVYLQHCLIVTFKIQDYFIISSEKLKCGWTLTTSQLWQYTITHIVYFKTQRTVIQNKKVINYLHNSHTHTHTLLWHLNRLSVQKCYWLFCSHCIRFRYMKSPTRRKKLIMFSKDVAVVIYTITLVSSCSFCLVIFLLMVHSPDFCQKTLK